MAEHNADREPQPIDEDAAWAAIVAGYGEEPADPPGAKPFKSVEDLALLESDHNSGTGPGDERDAATAERERPERDPAREPGADAAKGAGEDPGRDALRDAPKGLEKASGRPGAATPAAP
ncbi:hypothetical protein DVH02_04680, partial [Streptomyces corynorhini]